MGDHVVPTLPNLINNFYPPNQPTAKRCLEFGKLIGDAIAAWAPDKKVAVVGSGGLSHFVVDEELDRRLITGLTQRDEAILTDFDQPTLMSGTSELRNWIAAAGAMLSGGLEETFSTYVPCYRSPAGTGAGNGFAIWEAPGA